MAGTLSILQKSLRSETSCCGAQRLSLGRADEAFLLCIGAVRSANRLDRLRTVLDSYDVNWSTLWDLATKHNLRPLFAHRLNGLAADLSVPTEIIDAIRADRFALTARNMVLQAELERIGLLFTSHGIPAAPLKGTALSKRLFQSMVARGSTDIDILVPQSSYGEARKLVLADGYNPIPVVKPGVRNHPFHGVPLFKLIGGAPLVLELHWNLSDPQFVSIDREALWNRMLSAAEPGQSLFELPAEELLVFLAIHSSKHTEGLLRPLADIDQLLVHEGQQLDWEHVLMIAERWDASDLLYFQLLAVSRLFATPVPYGTMQRLRPQWWKRALVDRIAGPYAIVNPLEKAYLQDSRFRLAHCVMLQPGRRIVRSYWHYVLMPVTDDESDDDRSARARLISPAVGITRTAMVLGASLGEVLRRAKTVWTQGQCHGTS